MHSNIMAASSRYRPPMLATERYAQWRSRFLRYIDTRPNSDALRKCILEGPYSLFIVIVPAVPATENSPADPEHTTVETLQSMSPKNKSHYESEKEAIHLILTGIGDEIYSTVDACKTTQEMSLEKSPFTMEKHWNLITQEWSRFVTIVKQQHKLDEVSYHKLFDILKYQKEVNELRAERIARNANLLALVATSQSNQDPYYQTPKSYKPYAPTSKESILTRSHATTRNKGKEIAKPITPPSELASEEDSNPEQAQRDTDMQKNLALIAKYFKKIYKPTNNNFRSSLNSKNKNVDTTLRYMNDNQSVQFGNQRTMTVVGARENVGSLVVQHTGIQCFNCKEFGHFAKECRKPKKVKDFTYHKEKMLLCKQVEQEAHYNYMAKIQEVPTADSGTDSEPLEQNDQNVVECDDKHVTLAKLIANLKLDTEFEKYKACNDRTVDYDKLKHKLNETLGLLAQKDIDIKEGLKFKAYEVLVVKEKHDELVKQSLLTKSHYEGLVKEKINVIIDLKQKEGRDIDKMISMEKQLKFLNEIVYKRNQTIQTIHMLAPKGPTFNGRPTFANPIYLKKAQSEIPCLYAFSYDQSNHANRLVPDREETLTLENKSRSKLNKDLVRPYDYTKYVESHEKEIDDLESDKAEFSNMYDIILQEYSLEKKSFSQTNVRQPKPSVLSKPAPFLDSLKRKSFSQTKTVPKTNVSESLSKPVTTQILHQTIRKDVSNTKLIKPGMYRIDNRTTQTRAPQLPQTSRNTNPCVSTSTRVAHKTNVSRPQLRRNQMTDKVMPNNSHVKAKKTEVEDHPRNSSISNQTKSITACNDNLKSKTSNVNVVCATYGKCLIDSNHFACVTKLLNDVNARTKKPNIVQLILFIVDSGCTKHMTGNLSLLCNFVEKYLDQLCSSCEVSKEKRSSFKTKTVPSSKGWLNLLHMDLCGPMRVASINGKKYIQSKGYRVYNKRTRLIVESIHLKFDEIKDMSEKSVANDTSGLVPQRQKALDYDNSDPVPQIQNVLPSADTTIPSKQEFDLLFGPLYDEFFNAGTSSVNKSSSPTNNSTQQNTLPSTNIHPTLEPSTLTNVHAEENNDNQAEDEFTNPFFTPVLEVVESSSCNIGNSNMHTFNQPQDSKYRWIKDHLVEQVHGNPSKPVQTRQQLATNLEMCIFDTRKSTSGGIQFLGDKLNSWMSKKQDCTAMSSAEAEYVALSASYAQLMWMRTQLKDYGFNYNKILLYCDS
nr:uncharacterized mitochondrial protein AtMg00810-like [Tanacetum cinerariifolium]